MLIFLPVSTTRVAASACGPVAVEFELPENSPSGDYEFRIFEKRNYSTSEKVSILISLLLFISVF